jgi:hypothetical protein
VDAKARDRRAAPTRTVKSCGPDAPTLAFKFARKYPRGDGDNKARSPGRARRNPLKPLRREGRVFRGTCGDYLVCFLPFAHEAAGALGTRLSLRPSCCWAEDFAKLGRSVPREGGRALHRHRPRKRATQYSRASVMEAKSCGVLDTPLSRGMTGFSGAASLRYSSIATPPPSPSSRRTSGSAPGSRTMCRR